MRAYYVMCTGKLSDLIDCTVLADFNLKPWFGLRFADVMCSLSGTSYSEQNKQEGDE